MKHRWMDVVKRSKDALSSSPKSDKSKSPAHPQQHRQSLAPPPPLPLSFGSSAASLSARTLIPRSQSMIDVISASMRSNDSDFAGEAENPAFFHFDDRCKSVSGECSVAKVLEQCVLQGGVHHTYMNVLTYLGSPLRADTCCYCMSVQWFRAFGGHDDFQVIPGACDEYFTATADDIGARILAKVMLEDEDVVKTKMLEYGPIKEDPEVRSKVEMYLERKSVLFMGLQSILVRDGDEYPNNVELRESWTLLIDDRRVRLTCESSLIPPFEALYTSDIKVEVVRSVPNEFCLHLAEHCFVHLRAESNVVRDIIVLTVRAFRNGAVSNDAVTLAVAKGLSPMLTIRSLAADVHTSAEDFVPAPTYDLPWHRVEPDPDVSDASSSSGLEVSPVGSRMSSSSFTGAGGVTGSSSSNTSVAAAASVTQSLTLDDELDDSLLLDAEALIGNAMKMGIKNQVLPRAPKRISIHDIADLQIVEALDTASNSPRQRQRQLSSDRPYGSVSSDAGSASSDRRTNSTSSNITGVITAVALDDAVRDFERVSAASATSDFEALRSQYTAAFCALQRELSDAKKRVTALTQRLDDTREENVAFRSDIATLQTALTAVHAADRANELVVSDLAQLVATTTPSSSTSGGEHKPLPENYY